MTLSGEPYVMIDMSSERYRHNRHSSLIDYTYGIARPGRACLSYSYFVHSVLNHNKLFNVESFLPVEYKSRLNIQEIP